MRGKLQAPRDANGKLALAPSMRPALYARETGSMDAKQARTIPPSFNEARALCAGNSASKLI